MEQILQVIEMVIIAFSRLWVGRQRRPTRKNLSGAIGQVLDGPNLGEPFVLAPKLLEKHVYCLGSTGAGKTNFVLKLFEQDVERSRSVVVVDLRGDLVQRALGVCVAKYVDPSRVTLIDLRERSLIVGFNPLAGGGEPFVRALHLLDVVRAESDSWGVQLEETLRNALLLLAHAGQPLTDLEAVLLDGTTAGDLSRRCLEPSVVAFFDRYGALSDEKRLAWALPVLNKVTPLLATPGLRAILGAPNAVNLEQVLARRGSVVLVALAVDELHRSARMLGALIVAAIARTMFARVNVPEPRRNPLRLYVDEFEAMASEAFEGLISEGRRFKLSLVLSHQNLSQLPAKLRSAIRNNVGLQALFACGYEDARALGGELPEGFGVDDLLSQAAGQVLLMPRGGEPVQLQIALSNHKVSDAEIQDFRRDVLQKVGLPLGQVLAGLQVPPKARSVNNLQRPWGMP